MAYEVVLRPNQTSNDFTVSAESLLIVKHAGSDVVLSLLTPEDTPVAIPQRTFTASADQRIVVPKGTVLRLTTASAGAAVWLGKIYRDSAGDLL